MSAPKPITVDNTKQELKLIEDELVANTINNTINNTNKTVFKKKEPRIAYGNFLLIAKAHPDAYQFTKATAAAAGYDIKAFEDGIVPANGFVLVDTKIQISLPIGCYGRIASRSGLAAKHSIEVGAGVIDQDYHGNIIVLLRNFSTTPYPFKRGDKIAQMIIEQYRTPPIRVVTNIEQVVGQTQRGSSGFGSTGY